VAVVVTVPRSLLKRYLIQVAQDDDRLELESGRRQSKTRMQEVLQWEMAICGAAFVFVLVLSLLCIRYVAGRVEGSVTVTDYILRNCDGIGFAIVLEPLLGLVLPHLGNGPPHVGFFGRWRLERDHFEEDYGGKAYDEKVGLNDLPQ